MTRATRRLVTICAPFVIGGMVALACMPPSYSVDYGTNQGPDHTREARP